jgi:hypothetical protein
VGLYAAKLTLTWFDIIATATKQEKMEDIMSKGPGRIMRSINAAIDGEPKRRFTYDDLATIAYDGPPTHSRQAHSREVAVQRAVRALVLEKRVSLGSDPVHWLRTVRAFDAEARSSASIVNVESVQVSS